MSGLAAKRVAIASVPWLVIGFCCGLPIAWLLVELLTRPEVWHAAVPDAFRWRLIGRTFAYDAIAATLGTLVAIPVALSAARGRSIVNWIVPLPLLLPSLVLTYGWTQVLARLGYQPIPQSRLDVARCIVALASWLWPGPALLIAFAARRLDADLLMHARLDGITARHVARSLAGPILLGFALALLLALSEFAVFEPTGISVIAVETRAVFETGASLDGSWPPPASALAERTSAALAVLLPNLIATVLVVVALAIGARKLEVDSTNATARAPTPRGASLAGTLLAAIVIAVPIAAMLLSLKQHFDPIRVAREFSPQLIGSTSLAIASTSVATLAGLAAAIARPGRWLDALALCGFLVGGQWAAIAMIGVFNHDWLAWFYNYSIGMAIAAYVCRFGWIALVAARMTHAASFRPLREMASLDGAGEFSAFTNVIVPLAWPLLAGAALLVFTLSLTEVPATTLLQPADTLVPMMMTWAHILNYDAMIEASLLLMIAVFAIGSVTTALVRRGVRR